MAITFTVASATQDSIKYLVAVSGGTTSTTRTQAQILADFGAMQGPLRAFLTNISTNAALWNKVNSTPQISSKFEPDGSVGMDCVCTFVQGTPNLLSINVAANGNAQLEIRFNHSSVR